MSVNRINIKVDNNQNVDLTKINKEQEEELANIFDLLTSEETSENTDVQENSAEAGGEKYTEVDEEINNQLQENIENIDYYLDSAYWGVGEDETEEDSTVDLADEKTSAAKETDTAENSTDETNAEETQGLKIELKDNNTDEEETIYLSDKSDIYQYVNSLDESKKQNILSQIDNIGNINKIVINPDGAIEIKADNIDINISSSGYFDYSSLNFFDNIEAFNVDEIFNTLDSDNSIEMPETNITDEQDTAQTQNNDENININTDTNTNAQITNEEIISSDENIPVDTNTNQEIQMPESTNSGINVDLGFDSFTDKDITVTGDMGDLGEQLEQLQEEREEVKTDLGEQQETFAATEGEKESEISQIDCELETEQTNMDGAQQEVDVAQTEVDSATADVDEAQAQCDADKATADTCNANLQQATDTAQQSQDAANTAQADNQAAQQAEAQAAQDSTNANNDLDTAVGNTNEAQGVADDKGQAYSAAQADTSQAFNVLNCANQKVASAQAEYNAAQAQASNCIESLWNKFKSWVASALDALRAAFSKKTLAEIQLERKQREEDEAKVASDEAQEALAERKQEQQDATDVANAAAIVLARKQDERSVSDQQYAEALVVLASAMDAQNAADGEYQSALQQYMDSNNYKVDAEGNLVDAQGNLVSASQVVSDLEGTIQELSQNRATTEASYEGVLSTISGAIQGDQTQIDNLTSEIESLAAQIQEEQEMIAMQEMMIATLADEKSQNLADKNSAGIGGDLAALVGKGYKEDEKAIETKKEALEKALLSGNKEDIKNAYIAIYGDNEVYVDATTGKVVDVNEITPEQAENITTKKVSDLSSGDIDAYMKNEAQATVEASQILSALDMGVFTVDGQDLTREQINEILSQQADELMQEMENAADRQGCISKAAGFCNKLIDIGTSETEAKARIESYRQAVEKLKTCSDPTQYAALYKQITGENLDTSSLVRLAAYKKVNDGEKSSTTQRTSNSKIPAESKCDLTQYVDDVVTAVDSNFGTTITDSTKKAEACKKALSVANGSPAKEAIEDYKSTQTSAKDAVIGVVSGLAATGAVALGTFLGICATPFTGGASLGLVAAGFAIAGTVGAAVSTGLNALDSRYDADGDGEKEWNYSWKEAGMDAAIGALNGMVGILADGAGSAVGGKIFSEAAEKAVTTTLKEAAKKTALKYTAKTVSGVVEGWIDGSFSSSGEYLIHAALDENVDFSFEQLKDSYFQGGAIAAVMNATMAVGTQALSDTFHHIKAKNILGEVNEMLAKEGADGSDISKIIAGSIDCDDASKYLIDAGDGTYKVNKYAITQMADNAKSAYKMLKKSGMDAGDIVDVLSNVSTDKMANLQSLVNTMKATGLFDADTFSNSQKASQFMDSIDDFDIDKKGNVSKLSVNNADGTKTKFEYDKDGKITRQRKFSANNTEKEFNQVESTEFTYDKKGNVVSRLDTDAKGNQIRTDAKGRKISEVKFDYDEDGHIIGKHEIKYDADGNVKSEVYHNLKSEEPIVSKTDFGYDTEGRIVTQDMVDVDGKKQGYIKYEYDENGNIVAERMYNSSDELVDEIKHEYDSNGKKVKTKAEVDGVEKEFTYNEDGEMIDPVTKKKVVSDVKDYDPKSKTKTEAGDVDTDPKTKTGDVDTKTKAGDVDTKTKAGDVDTKTKTGDVDTKTKTGDVDTKTKTGDVDTKTKTGDVDTKTKAGDVDTKTNKPNTISEDNIQKRSENLVKNKRISKEAADKIAKLDDVQYERAVKALDNNVSPEQAMKVASFSDAQYSVFEKGMLIEDVAKLSDSQAKLIKELIDKGVDVDKINSISNLGDFSLRSIDSIDNFEIDPKTGELRAVSIKNADGSTINVKLEDNGKGYEIYKYDTNGKEISRAQYFENGNIEGSGNSGYEFRKSNTSDVDVKTGDVNDISLREANATKAKHEFESKSTRQVYNELKRNGYVENLNLGHDVLNDMEFNPALRDDLEKLYIAYKMGVTPREVFVPSLKDANTAAKTLNVGDVCILDGDDRISIKLPDGTMQKLNLSAEKYMELFPPAERYAFKQQIVGDCYLVSSLYEMETNPNTRHLLLQSFNEDANGNIIVKMPGSGMSVDPSKLDSLRYMGTTVKGADGIRMLEHAYGKKLQYNAPENLSKIKSTTLEQIATTRGDITHIKEVIDLFDYVKKAKDIDVSDITKRFQALGFSEEHVSGFIAVTDNGIVKNFDAIDEYIDTWQNGLDSNKEFLKTNLKKLRQTKRDINSYSTSDYYAIRLRNKGGWMDEAWSQYGLDATRVYGDASFDFAEFVAPDGSSNYIFGAGSNSKMTPSMIKHRIVNGHAYSVQPFKSNSGEILYRVTNPWNTSVSKIMSMEEMRKCFDQFYYAKVK